MSLSLSLSLCVCSVFSIDFSFSGAWGHASGARVQAKDGIALGAGDGDRDPSLRSDRDRLLVRAVYTSLARESHARAPRAASVGKQQQERLRRVLDRRGGWHQRPKRRR